MTAVQLSFFFDPVCPWCWITACWLLEVRTRREVEIRWAPFSLDIKNQDLALSDRARRNQREGRRALRVTEAARASHGEVAVEQLYLEMGRRYHHDDQRTFALDAIVAAVGLPPAVAAAADDDAWDEPIEEAMEQVAVVVGDDVGVPTIILESSESVGFYGPIFSPAPTGEAAAELFDHVVEVAKVPGFFELKRDRDTSPRFGPRPG
jgi:predicted DsbA family dithiol-disulfide isomerase